MILDELFNRISKAYISILKENLIGIYIHGSIAFDCFTWEKSDIDFIVVVQSPLELKDKVSLIQVLQQLEKDAPKKGFEMSIVLLQYCQSFVYPVPFEIHYSLLHQKDALEDLEGYCSRMHGYDEDLACAFTILRHRGICQWGKPIPEVFQEVPKRDYWKSIIYDLMDAVECIKQHPMYSILNLCRTLAFKEQEKILSKKEGGEWALYHLPEIYHPLINQALQEYQNIETPIYEEALCQSFVSYMQQRLPIEENSV